MAGANTKRVGIFGGTFDPPHVGHIAVACEVRWALGLDELLMVVANDPWQKSRERAVTPAQLRLSMVEAAVADIDGLVASSLEIDRGGASYTIDTVEQLLAADSDLEISLVLGADSVANLDTWHRSDELASLVRIARVERPDSPGPSHDDPESFPIDARWRIDAVQVPQIALSSTEVRERCADGRPIDALVPHGARSIIREAALYGWGR